MSDKAKEAVLSVEPLFSSPLARFQVKDFVNTYIDVDLSLETDDRWFKNPKQYNVWNHDCHDILAEEGFEDLESMVQSGVESYIYNVLCFSKDIKAVRTSSWLTIGLNECSTGEHLHTNSIYSGILYLKSLPKSGDLYFIAGDYPNYCTTTVKPIPETLNVFNSNSYYVTPNSGDLFVFPSHLRHGVTPNTSGESRCALAFNYFLSGKLCEQHTSYLELNL